MPGRMRVFLEQTRKPIPAIPGAPPVRLSGKSMAERWAEHKREEKAGEKKSEKGNSSGAQF